jgi:hypothetical protein
MYVQRRFLLLTKDRDKFVRLANARVNKALNAIRLIGNLSNRSNYSYTEDDVEKIFRALSTALKDCKGKFQRDGSADDHTFHLQ